MIRNVYLRIALLFGLLGAALILAYFLVLYAAGTNPLPEMNKLDLLIILLCTLFAMGYFRDRLNRGVLHFWQGLVLGMPVVLLSALVSSLVIYGFTVWIPDLFPDYLNQMQKLIEADYQAGRIKDEAYYRNLLKSLPAVSRFSKALDIFLKNFFICFFATGLLAMIMRKHPRPAM